MPGWHSAPRWAARSSHLGAAGCELTCCLLRNLPAHKDSPCWRRLCCCASAARLAGRPATWQPLEAHELAQQVRRRLTSRVERRRRGKSRRPASRLSQVQSSAGLRTRWRRCCHENQSRPVTARFGRSQPAEMRPPIASRQWPVAGQSGLVRRRLMRPARGRRRCCATTVKAASARRDGRSAWLAGRHSKLHASRPTGVSLQAAGKPASWRARESRRPTSRPADSPAGWLAKVDGSQR